jgi:hypothetical protein
MTLFANENLRRYVAIVEGRELVADGRLPDLRRVDGLELETTEILVNRADVDQARPRFLRSGRLN